MKNNCKNFALVDEHNTLINYNSLILRKKKIEKFFKEKKVVFLLAENNIELISEYLCLFLLKQTVVILNNSLSRSSLDKLIQKFKPNYIFLNKKISSKFFLSKKKYETANFCMMEINKKNVFPNKELFLILPTSGSSGSSKFVKLSFKNIIFNSNAIIKYTKLRSKDMSVTILPFYYSYGISVINSHFFSGGKILVTNRNFFDPTFWQNLEKFKVTNLSLVPFQYEILKKIGLKRIAINSIKFLTQAGGKLDINLANKITKYILKLKKNFYIMYGQTEASPRISYIKNQNILKYPGSVGKAIPGGRIFINKANFNGIGEIIYYGPNVFCGYFESINDYRNCKSLLKLNTSDLGYLKKNNLYIVGRKSREEKIYSIRINLDKLEENFNKFEIKAIIKGMKLFIFIKKNKLKNLSHIRNLITKDYGLSKSMLRFIVINKIPLLSNNKVNYLELKRIAR